MTTGQVLEQLKQMNDIERLQVVEEATRLVRKHLATVSMDATTQQEQRIRTAAAGIKDLYESGGGLTEWTALDSEEFSDDYIKG
jgi:hypothetical protein